MRVKQVRLVSVAGRPGLISVVLTYSSLNQPTQRPLGTLKGDRERGGERERRGGGERVRGAINLWNNYIILSAGVGREIS